MLSKAPGTYNECEGIFPDGKYTLVDFEGGKASNPVVSNDGKYMSFQFANTADPAGVGYGYFFIHLKNEKFYFYINRPLKNPDRQE